MSQTEVNLRRNIERQIVTTVVEEALSRGYFMQAEYDGEEFLEPTQNKKEVIDTLMNLDAVYLNLYFTEAKAKRNQPADAWILFVFGNDIGETVVSDYTTNLEDIVNGEDVGLLHKANAISNAIENGNFTIKIK